MAVWIAWKGAFGKPAFADIPCPGVADALATDDAVFRFRGERLVSATPGALSLIEAPVPGDREFDALARYLGTIAPDLPGLARRLVDHGTGFRTSVRRDDMRYDVRGQRERGTSVIAVAMVPTWEERIEVNAARHATDMEELARLRAAVSAAPFLVWEEAEDGSVAWHNRAYEAVAEAVLPDHDPRRWPGPRLFEPDGTDADDGPRRAGVSLADQGRTWWFETYTRRDDAGRRLRFAIHADPLVKAEVALRNFVQTLTRTFAHLPIGLAVFDSNRRLSIFNPALADLTTLEPEWLGTRPTVGTFLDRLRERRMIPEPRDYGRWRERMVDLIRAAEDGTFEESWPLPGGQTFRVTGRPHREGAVAFIIEDITAEVTLKRQFRAELAAAQAALDAMDPAICVFSGLGTLALTNAAFAATFGFAADETMVEMPVPEATRKMAEHARAAPFWGDLRAFVSGETDRETWEDGIVLTDGTEVPVTVVPLPGGFTFCRFDVPAVHRARPADRAALHALDPTG